VRDAFGDLVNRWRLAEQRLYPTILADPSAYQRYVLAVRGLADELSVVASPEALAASWATSSAASHRGAAEHLREVGGPDDEWAADLVAGAAFALREREIAAALLGRARALTLPALEREDSRR
jgi:hypothetical protein